jgi:hypothetical protein
VHSEKYGACVHGANLSRVCAVLIFWTYSSFSAVPAEALGKTVVFLKIRQAVKEQVGTNSLEVYYRSTGANTFEPKAQEVAGTGFCLLHDGQTYIVTAGHLAAGCLGGWIVFPTTGQNAELELAAIQKITGAGWYLHPTVDLAVHPYLAFGGTSSSLEDLAESLVKTNELGLLTPVCAVGFPLGLGVQPAISPIAVQCNIASALIELPDPQFNKAPGLRYILLDQALAQGYSGAPVLTLPSAIGPDGALQAGLYRPVLVGVNSAQKSDLLGGKHSVVVPGRYLLEMFSSQDFIHFHQTIKANIRRSREKAGLPPVI